MLTEEQIKEINERCPENQGIFFEPSGIPYKIKDKVVYMRWEVGGSGGAGYREHDRAYYYNNDRPTFLSLEYVIELYKPEGLTTEERSLVDRLIIEGDNDMDNEDYYGNYEEWQTEFVILPVLIALLETFKN